MAAAGAVRGYHGNRRPLPASGPPFPAGRVPARRPIESGGGGASRPTVPCGSRGARHAGSCSSLPSSWAAGVGELGEGDPGRGREPPHGGQGVHGEAAPKGDKEGSSGAGAFWGIRGRGEGKKGPESAPGWEMEQIKRANRLYTSDTIFLKPTLLIPGQLGPEEEEEEEEEGAAGLACPATSRHDLSATDFLRQIDAEIRLSKAAATRRLREGSTRAPDTGAHPAPQGARRALLGPRPLTRTPRAAALHDAEDEIFTL
uniref:LysM domain containing 1 n=1 Tax=Dromaius novaehollandiae TaxID=8790 RepID=A0A8C4P2X4_DRONO